MSVCEGGREREGERGGGGEREGLRVGLGASPAPRPVVPAGLATGYLAHKKPPPSPGLPQGPKHSPTVGIGERPQGRFTAKHSVVVGRCDVSSVGPVDGRRQRNLGAVTTGVPDARRAARGGRAECVCVCERESERESV